MTRDSAPASPLPDPRAGAPELRAFVAVARSGAVGRAAEQLGRTQPSISARLSGLERSWATRLFRRTSRGMELTPEGARLLPLAEAALSELERLDRAAGLPLRHPGELRLGAGDALGRELLPRALSVLQRERPTLEIRLREGPGSLLLEALRGGEIDLALVVRPEPGPLPPGLDLQPLIRSRVDLLAPLGFGRRTARSVGLRALAGERLVALQSGSGFRRLLESAFAAARVPFHPAVEVGNLSLVRRFVAAGLGVAPVPAVAFRETDRLARVRRVELRGVPALEYMGAVRAGAPPPPDARRLLELIGIRS